MRLMNLFKPESNPGGALPGLQAWPRMLLAELSECLPSWLRRLFGKAGGRMELHFDQRGAETVLVKAGETAQHAIVEKGDKLALKDMLKQAERAHADVVLMAPADQVLRRVVFMPLQVRDNLPKVLQYELERLTPFQAEHIFFDFRLLPHEVPDQIRLELALIKRDRVEPWLRSLSALGGRTKTLNWSGAWPGANLLPLELRQGKAPGSRVVSLILWVLVLLLAAAVLTTPLLQKHRLAADLDRQVKTMQTKVEQVSVLREQVRQVSDSVNQVLNLKREAVYSIEVLRKLTDLLPDHTWVEQWNVDKYKISFRGESKQATGLIEILSSVPELRNVSFMSPVVGIKNTDKERFHIAFEVAKAEMDQ